MREKWQRVGVILLICMFMMSSFGSIHALASDDQSTAVAAEEVETETTEQNTTEVSDEASTTKTQQAELNGSDKTEKVEATDNESSIGKEDSGIATSSVEQSDAQPARTYKAECEEAEVTVDVPDGAFDEPVSLVMETIEEQSFAYQQAKDVLAKENDHDGMLAFDIYFRNADGQEVEPKEQVTVSIKAKFNENADILDGSLMISHIDESGQEAIAQIVASESEGTLQVENTEISAEFEVESFSIFALTWYSGNPIYIHCIDENGNEIGSGYQDNIRGDILVESRWTNRVFKYTYLKAVIARNATEAANGRGTTVTHLTRKNGIWQYSPNERDLYDVGNNTVYFIYEPTVLNVCVYVAGRHLDKSTPFSNEMLDLLKVSTLDRWGYFAAGTLQLDLSKLSGTSVSTMILTDADWDYVLEELKNNLNTKNSSNAPNNLIAQYAEQVLRDYGKTQNQMFSGLWVSGGNGNAVKNGTIVNGNGSPQSNGGSTWHLDLRFNTVKITYIYGNNGITGSVARDGTQAGSKIFIQGATMDYTPTITAPNGYKIMGYYSDPNCTEGNEWNAVGQPINEDTNVYIKIVPMNDVVINYVVEEGEGTVTNPSNNNVNAQSGYEHFNPRTGIVKGSTATPATDWEFEGWYSDEALTDKVSSDQEYVPSAPAGGWKEGSEHTYYAKFVRKKMPVTITKKVTGSMGDVNRKFSFKVTDVDGNTFEFDLSNSKSETIENLPMGTVLTLIEKGAEEYSTSATYGADPVDPKEEGSKTFEFTLRDGVNEIVVTNHRQVQPPTGIFTNNTVYFAMLGVSLLLAASVVIFSRRRQRYE